MPDTEIHAEEKPAACANCGALLAGPYCAQCGQHVADYHRSVWRFVADFFDNTFCWDNKFFRTLGPLFGRPGFLTLEFMRGRRVRYVHPLRLFLFTSAVCLALIQASHSFTLRGGEDAANHSKTAKRGTQVDFGTDPTPSATPTAAAAPTATAKKHDEENADSTPPSPKEISQLLRHDLAKKRARKNEGGGDTADELQAKIETAVADRLDKVGDAKMLGDKLVKDIQQRLSWVALALLPVFALGLRAVYWRQDSFYFGHLVFSLHHHTFLLMYLALISVAQILADALHLHALAGWLALPVILAPPVYLYLALRRMYGESRRRAFVKTMLLGGFHLLLIVVGVSMVGTYGFFF